MFSVFFFLTIFFPDWSLLRPGFGPRALCLNMCGINLIINLLFIHKKNFARFSVEMATDSLKQIQIVQANRKLTIFLLFSSLWKVEQTVKG